MFIRGNCDIISLLIFERKGLAPRYIMSEKELDEILNEIKRNGRASSAEPASDKTEFTINEEKVDVKKAVDDFSSFSITSDEPKPASDDLDTNIFSQKSDDDVAIDLDAFSSERVERAPKSEKKNKDSNSNKKIIIAVIAVIVAVAVGVGVYFGFFHNNDDGTVGAVKRTTTTAQSEEPVLNTTINPLTGEPGFDDAALTQRPVAVVVENEYSTESVRPQWGLADADIVLEGESEFSTRLLLFWADYNKVPAQVGPARSARPPFIYFSQLFDAVFIHAGLSHSRGNYVGASEVFKNNNIDHINLLSLSEDSGYFGRDKSKTSTIEHTGYLNGTNTAKLLESKGINTQLNESKFTRFVFNSEAQPLSENIANTVRYKWSSNCPKKATFTYDTASKVYTTTDFDSQYGIAGVKWQNIILLNDQTEYVVKQNYKGQGGSETYCNYNLTGGDGLVASQGTSVAIKWGVTDGKLWLHDAATGDDIALNPGKSYIGYGSSNHGGEFSAE